MSFEKEIKTLEKLIQMTSDGKMRCEFHRRIKHFKYLDHLKSKLTKSNKK